MFGVLNVTLTSYSSSPDSIFSMSSNPFVEATSYSSFDPF